jgi:hypothetical protein
MEYDMTLAQQSYTLAERWSKTKDTSEFSATDISGMDANQIGEHEYRLWSLLLTASYKALSLNDYNHSTRCQ